MAKSDRGAKTGLDEVQQEGEPQIPLQALPLAMLDLLGPGLELGSRRGQRER